MAPIQLNRGSRSMSHCVNDIVHAQPDCLGGIAFGVLRIVGELPAIAYVHIEANGDDHAAFGIANRPPMRRHAAALDAGAMYHVRSRDADTLLHVVEHMESWIGVIELHRFGPWVD